MPILSIEDLTYSYPNTDTHALNHISLEIEQGEFVLICGSTGAGKTTICRSILGLVPHFFGGAMSGKVSVQGVDTRSVEPSHLAPKVGLVFQNPEDQMITMSVEEELAFGPENLGLPRIEIKERIEEVLSILSLHELRHRSPYELSSGQQQKVAIAAILAMHPEILILDEPTSMIDPKTSVEIADFLKELKQQKGTTIIVTEHKIADMICAADKIVVMDKGRVVESGRPQDILSSEDLLEIGVTVPRIIQLANRLKKAGLQIEDLPLTVDKACSMLRSLI